MSKIQSNIVGKKVSIILNKAFLKKTEKNPNYSLRAFARYLDMDPTALSRFMKQQRTPTKPTAVKVLQKLDLNIEDFFKTFTPSPESKNNEVLLSDDILKLVPKWYFFAILDLFNLKNFRSDPKWMAKRLNLSVSKIQSALSILENAELIEKNNGGWKLKLHSSNWASPSTSTTKKNLHKQLLDQAKLALDDIDFSKRDASSLSLPCNQELIPEIKKLIQKFKNDTREFIENHGEYNEVYQLIINFFPLTREASFEENE